MYWGIVEEWRAVAGAEVAGGLKLGRSSDRRSVPAAGIELALASEFLGISVEEDAQGNISGDRRSLIATDCFSFIVVSSLLFCV